MTVEVSKQNAYAILEGSSADVSKQNAYAVLEATDVAVSKQVVYVVVDSPTGVSNVRVPLAVAEPVTGGDANVRTPLALAEPVTAGNANVRTPYALSEPVTGGNSVVRVPLAVLEVFYAVPEENPVATEILPIASPITAPMISASNPGLPGLTFSVHKKPMWRTDVAGAVSGREVRTARMQVPKWKFELRFDFLDSRDGADPTQQMERLAGFFCTVRGRWAAWLYQDPTDYFVEGQQIGIGDGGVTGFDVLHTLGAYTEPVGQIDLANLFQFTDADVNTGTDTVTVADHGLETGYGPIQFTNPGTLPTGLSALTNYWVIVLTDSTLQFALSKADALAGTEVDITAAGSGTNTASNAVAVYNDGTQVAPADYTVTMPNQIVFDAAPGIGDVLTVDCKFYFVCRFMDDEADFEQFMYKLWSLETLEFETDIP